MSTVKSARSEQAQSSSATNSKSDRPVTEFAQFGTAARSNGFSTTVTTVNHGDAAEMCQQQAQKLFSLISMISGEGFESFECHDSNIKACVMWLLSDLANEVAVLAELTTAASVGQVGGAHE